MNNPFGDTPISTSKSPFGDSPVSTTFVNEDVPPAGGYPQSQTQKPERTLSEKLEGIDETALTLLTGATTGALGYATGAVEGAARNLMGDMTQEEAQKLAESRASAMTYSPKGEAGQEYVKGISEAAGVLPPVLGMTPVSALRAAIPKGNIPRNILRNKTSKKNLLKREIAAGNPNIETIAKTLNSSGDIIDIPSSKAALKVLGDGERNRELISVVERLDPASKKQMNKMLDVIVDKKKYPDIDARPSDIIGDSITNRARAIATKNDQASKRIGSIASSLKTKDVNIQAPVNEFFTELSDLGVTFKKGDDGWVTPDFSRSKFSGGSQKDMNVLVNDLLNPNTKFESSHKLKQEIRKNIDFDKGGKDAIDRNSQEILRKLSSGIDGVLDNDSKAYKKANDTFAKTVKLKDDYQKMAGKDIDLFSDLSKEALANKARRLSSNAQSRTAIKQTLTDSDAVLKDLGIEFKDNIHSLNFVVNRLDDLFKITPDTSMQGVLERGIDASFSPMAATKQGLDKLKSTFSASDAKKIGALKAMLK